MSFGVTSSVISTMSLRIVALRGNVEKAKISAQRERILCADEYLDSLVKKIDIFFKSYGMNGNELLAEDSAQVEYGLKDIEAHIYAFRRGFSVLHCSCNEGGAFPEGYECIYRLDADSSLRTSIVGIAREIHDLGEEIHQQLVIPIERISLGSSLVAFPAVSSVGSGVQELDSTCLNILSVFFDDSFDAAASSMALASSEDMPSLCFLDKIRRSLSNGFLQPEKTYYKNALFAKKEQIGDAESFMFRVGEFGRSELGCLLGSMNESQDMLSVVSEHLSTQAGETFSDVSSNVGSYAFQFLCDLFKTMPGMECGLLKEPLSLVGLDHFCKTEKYVADVIYKLVRFNRDSMLSSGAGFVDQLKEEGRQVIESCLKQRLSAFFSGYNFCYLERIGFHDRVPLRNSKSQLLQIRGELAEEVAINLTAKRYQLEAQTYIDRPDQPLADSQIKLGDIGIFSNIEFMRIYEDPSVTSRKELWNRSAYKILFPLDEEEYSSETDYMRRIDPSIADQIRAGSMAFREYDSRLWLSRTEMDVLVARYCEDDKFQMVEFVQVKSGEADVPANAEAQNEKAIETLGLIPDTEVALCQRLTSTTLGANILDRFEIGDRSAIRHSTIGPMNRWFSSLAIQGDSSCFTFGETDKQLLELAKNMQSWRQAESDRSTTVSQDVSVEGPAMREAELGCAESLQHAGLGAAKVTQVVSVGDPAMREAVFGGEESLQPAGWGVAGAGAVSPISWTEHSLSATNRSDCGCLFDEQHEAGILDHFTQLAYDLSEASSVSLAINSIMFPEKSMGLVSEKENPFSVCSFGCGVNSYASSSATTPRREMRSQFSLSINMYLQRFEIVLSFENHFAFQRKRDLVERAHQKVV
jgi:hypothetical protein